MFCLLQPVFFFMLLLKPFQAQNINGSAIVVNNNGSNENGRQVDVKLTIVLQNEGQPLFGNVSAANGSTFNVHLPKVVSINIGSGNFTSDNTYHDHDHDHDHDHTNDHNHDHAHDHDHDHDHNYQFPPGLMPANASGFGNDNGIGNNSSNVPNGIVDDTVVDAGNADDQ